MAVYTEMSFDSAEIQRFLGDISNNLKSVVGGKKKWLGGVSSIVFRDVMDHFEKEKGESGKWEPWSEVYRQHMDRIGRGGNKILQFNGRLRQNFKPQNVRSSSKGFSWFNDAKTKSGYAYAAGHDEGDGKLPERSFMWLSDQSLEDISQFTLGFILEEGI